MVLVFAFGLPACADVSNRNANPWEPLPTNQNYRHREPVGYLTVYSEPMAEVLIDGVSTRQMTPARRIRVSVGKHTVTLVAHSKRAVIEVEVERDDEKVVTRTRGSW